MPNWVSVDVDITGDNETLAEIKAQLSQPYETTVMRFDKTTKQFVEENATITGDFLMWNIIRPLNMEAYHKQEEIKPVSERPEFSDFVTEFQHKVDTDENWYYWNIRNWGTKWEIDEATCVVKDGVLGYFYQTAWSPNVPALAKLAEQYPTVSILARFIEEGISFAGEVYWENGVEVYDRDLEINHATLLDFNGECWVCLDEDKELMEDYGCIEYQKAVDSLG